MALDSIRLVNFRSYRDETFELEKGVNIIVGPNASGKTNLLEAIGIICIGKSHRLKERELIRFSQTWARIDATKDSAARSFKLELLPNEKSRKTFIINNQTSTRLPLPKTSPAVLFEPNHMQLLIGKPGLRRDFLDDLIEQTSLDFGKIRSKYNRVLTQRNTLLKKGPISAKEQIFPWDIRLSELAGRIVKERSHIISKFNQQINQLYKKLSRAKTNIELVYETTIPVTNFESRYLIALQKNLELDATRGFTTIGPHRDDLGVLVDGHPAMEVASRGEIRTLLLALKIMEVKLVEVSRGQKPILLLDDVFSELDGARRRALTKFLKNYQTFITTTDADVVVQHFMDDCHIIPLTKNQM